MDRPTPAAGDPALATGSLADRAYVILRDRLVSLDIQPGSTIDEERIGRELEMGRTPVREAIRRLVLEDLVNVYPRRGTFAADINITDLAAISEVRLALEGHAARLAAQRITPDRQAQVAALLEELRTSVGSDRARELMDLDAQVHRFVHACAGNRYLEQTLARYLNLSMRIWHLVLDRLPGLLERVHEHAELLEAIRDRDADRAEAVARRHVTTFEREIRAVL